MISELHVNLCIIQGLTPKICNKQGLTPLLVAEYGDAGAVVDHVVGGEGASESEPEETGGIAELFDLFVA